MHRTPEQQAALSARELANFLNSGQVEVADLDVLSSLLERVTQECNQVVESAKERSPETRIAQIEVEAASTQSK